MYPLKKHPPKDDGSLDPTFDSGVPRQGGCRKISKSTATNTVTSTSTQYPHSTILIKVARFLLPHYFPACPPSHFIPSHRLDTFILFPPKNPPTFLSHSPSCFAGAFPPPPSLPSLPSFFYIATLTVPLPFPQSIPPLPSPSSSICPHLFLLCSHPHPFLPLSPPFLHPLLHKVHRPPRRAPPAIKVR